MKPRELREALDSMKGPLDLLLVHDAARLIALPILDQSPEVREAIKTAWYAATPEQMVDTVLRELAALTDTEEE